jgi:hypothetical protein
MHNNGSKDNRFLVQLAAQKKKTVIAVCLITVMAFMWVKVLIKKAPQDAQASPATKQESPDVQMSSQFMVSAVEPLKVSFIDLPEVAGRNDVITRDFFDVDGWQEFVGDKEGNRSASIKDVNVASGDGSQEVVRRVVEKLKLEAIVLGKNPQTFINGKLLSRGDKLLISDGTMTYECEVVGIEENTVFMRCGNAQITLKLAQAIEVNR